MEVDHELQENSSVALPYAHLFALDHFISTAYTVLFAVIWWVLTPHDGRRIANSEAQKAMQGVGAGPYDPNERKALAEGVWSSERGFAAAVLVLGWFLKVRSLPISCFSIADPRSDLLHPHTLLVRFTSTQRIISHSPSLETDTPHRTHRQRHTSRRHDRRIEESFTFARHGRRKMDVGFLLFADDEFAAIRLFARAVAERGIGFGSEKVGRGDGRG